jgi:hypothetical protein
MELREGRLQNSPYDHTNHIGLYIGIFLYEKSIPIKQASKEANVSLPIFKAIIAGTYNVGLQSYFRIADFMATKSLYDIGFFLRRLKEEIEKGDLIEIK